MADAFYWTNCMAVCSNFLYLKSSEGIVYCVNFSGSEMFSLQTQFSEVQALQFKRSSPFSPKLLSGNRRCLYNQPAAKRVWAYLNGYKPKQGVYAWGKTIAEVKVQEKEYVFQNCCQVLTERLSLLKPMGKTWSFKAQSLCLHNSFDSPSRIVGRKSGLKIHSL